MSPATTVIHSARLVGTGGIVVDAWVRFDGDRVAARGLGDTWRDGLPTAAEVTDAAGRFLTPGFIDLHCHGAGGASVDEGVEAIGRTLAVHNAHGTTRSVLSLVTASVDRLVPQLETIAGVAAVDARVLGSHLEGPFLDAEFRGAHDSSLLRTADAASVDRLIAAAGGTLRQVTIAPEHDGASVAISRFIDAGVQVAVGHTGADFDTALAAFDAGATILTHAFNGMRGIHHRAPGPVLAAMHADHVTLEVINDGVHVHPDVVRLAFAGAPGRVALVTDAMAATGSADGTYLLGSLEVLVEGGVARLVEGGSIAGSTLTHDVALRRAVIDSGIALEAAVGALTVTPAAAIGQAHDLGRLDPGYAADAVLLDDGLEVTAVWGAGARLA
ncbi:N-acetylglucosamine-6-phosphate deacetylase [Agromyces ramosus]|uniref:N-acetylglucosamine-6-phosphate deacetylase n=1 Tax=Agromyces ramosus TaxID=33879 RepID=A0ABU0R4X6_9MICO|nr:N-acetylglucosamine-6-phosphate deacetylase [Agromyces ramosus]MDQ0893129.1 N-acetylglucosamine-6-phosphate deacetylase [Agromyces ramosus]